jgi:hypothetical protein
MMAAPAQPAKLASSPFPPRPARSGPRPKRAGCREISFPRGASPLRYDPHPAAAADPSSAPIRQFASYMPSLRAARKCRQNVIHPAGVSDPGFCRCLLLREGDDPAGGGLSDSARSRLETVGACPESACAVLICSVPVLFSTSPIRRTPAVRITQFGTHAALFSRCSDSPACPWRTSSPGRTRERP